MCNKYLSLLSEDQVENSHRKPETWPPNQLYPGNDLSSSNRHQMRRSFSAYFVSLCVWNTEKWKALTAWAVAVTLLWERSVSVVEVPLWSDGLNVILSFKKRSHKTAYVKDGSKSYHSDLLFICFQSSPSRSKRRADLSFSGIIHPYTLDPD